MKNLHLLKTDKPSRLIKFFTNNYHLSKEILPIQDEEQYNNIYITDDSDIREGNWVYSEARNTLFKVKSKSITSTGTILIEDDVIMTLEINEVDCKKIIITTDEDLITDGIQCINEEFLQWIVKNPSCEFIELKYENICSRCHSNDTDECWSAKECSDGKYDEIRYKIIIPKEEPKQERMYSEEDMKKMYDVSCGIICLSYVDDQTENNKRFNYFLNKIKK